jgi:hypothetical protein
MKEIILGTIEDMVEWLKEYLRRQLRWAEQWLGVHYIVAGIFFGMVSYFITYPEHTPPDTFFIIAFGIYIIVAWHWINTRKPRFWRDENGIYRFTYNPIHGDRAVLNPIQRAKDIRANNKIPVITLVKGNKVKVEQDGGKYTRTAETFGMVGKYGKQTKSWNMAKQFCLNSGIVDFKNEVNWNLESERDKVRKQLERFRKDLSSGLGIPDFELGTDYKFYRGVFEWKTVVWRDTSISQDVRDQYAEADTIMRMKTANAYVKASYANPEIEDVDLYEHRE